MQKKISEKHFSTKKNMGGRKEVQSKATFFLIHEKRGKFFHMMYFMLTFPKKGEKGVYFNIWNTRLGLILSLIASLAMT